MVRKRQDKYNWEQQQCKDGWITYKNRPNKTIHGVIVGQKAGWDYACYLK